MAFTRLSDAELRRLVLEDGETAPGAREELEQRHYQAVRAFADVVSPSAGDALAGQAWQQALRPLDEDITGAVRPRALSAVLRIAADWLRTGQRSALAPALVSWFEPDGADALDEANGAQGLDGDALDGADGADRAGDTGGDAGAARLAYSRSSSITAQAFERLPARSQTVLWHHEVERDDAATVEQLLGAVAEDVDLLNRRARTELYNIYVSLHQDETVEDACRRLHRMLLAYAEATSMLNTPGDLVSHLDRCAHCAKAVDDLERMRFEFGSVLAEALLPWGGADYALAAHTLSSTTFNVSGAEGPGKAGAGRRVLGAFRTGLLALPGTRALAGDRHSPRARRLVLSAALVGLCSLVVAVAYTGGLRQGAENNSAPRPGNTSGAPAPPGAEPTATATSTVTATPPGRGNPPGNGYRASSVRGAALEWLFDKVDDGRTADTSGNGIDGALDGDPLPEPVKGGALEFSGEQSVVSDGPVVDTSKSYSVSARAKMNDTEDFQTVISQDAEEISGFAVQYDPDADRWEMIIPEEDEAESEHIQAGGSPGPPADRWTYLTGVYDASAGRLRLYVDGKLEDTARVGGGGAYAGRRSGTGSSSTTTTTTTTTSGGGGRFDGNGNLNGNGDGFDGGRGGFGGSGGAGAGGGGGYFGGASGGAGGLTADQNLPGSDLAEGIIRDVTGSLAGTEVVQADGNFAVGRGLAGEEFVRGFDGAIDDVRAFKRALSAKEVAHLAGR